MEANKSLFYNRTLYLTEFTNELTMVLPAQELKAAPPFSPILSQYGLNANEFCEKFNKETIIFPVGTPIPTSIFYIPKEKKFDFCFRPFQLKHILQQFVTYDEIQKIYIINYINLYKTLLIKSDILNDKNLFRIFRNILGTLKSYDRPLMIEIPGKSFLDTGEFPIDINEEEVTDDEEFIINLNHKINKNFWTRLKETNNLENLQKNKEKKQKVLVKKKKYI